MAGRKTSWPTGISPADDQPGPVRIWRVRLYWRDPKTGRRREENKHVTGTLAEAVTFREKLAAEVSGPAKPKRVRFEDYIDTWVEAHSLLVRDSTLEHISSIGDNHLIPRFGDWFVDAITVRDVQRWMLDQRDAGAAPGTINVRLSILRSVLKAWSEETGTTHPAAKVSAMRDPPRTDEDTDPNSLTPEQLAKGIAFLEERPFWRTYLYLGCVTGMRPGELAALKWTRVDYGTHLIHIVESFRRGRLGPTKNGKPRRAPMAPEVEDALRAHRRWLVETQHRGVETGLVFPSPNLGTYLTTTTPAYFMAQIAEHLKLPRLTPKALRRTYMDLAREAGVAGLVMRAIAGHTEEKMSEVYSTVRRKELLAAGASVVALTRSSDKESDK